ncbi:MAG: thiamine permease [Sulfobacillus acidophilus]|uniref:Thiamine permease n=1 Tax=Sulfobacillus acidophilus TaxID=53633 RepID=A0A2T2WNV9_9FIRM|nr:MAG: thiamine permease [Sulfobacillus acidophilus]
MKSIDSPKGHDGGILGQVETVGVLPVPDRERTMSPGKMTVVWLMASASATTPLIGALLFHFGVTDMILAIVLSWLIGVIPTGLFSEMGREVPLTGLIVARKSYGTAGAFLFSVLFTFVNMGWFGLNTAVAGETLSAITHMPGSLWFWTIGAIQVFLVLFGMKWLEYFYRYTSVVLLVCYGVLAYLLFSRYHVSMPGATAPMQWGSAITTIVTFSILAWTYKVSTVSRFARPASDSRGKTAFFLAPSIGIMASVLVMGIMGMYSQQATGNWNLALLGAHAPVWGVIAAVGVALAIIHTNAMNLYPSTVDLLVALNTVHRPTKWEQPIATIILGILGTVLAILGILNHVSGFLDVIGDVIIPFTFVMLVDWVWVQRKRTPASAFFEHPKTARAWWSWSAIVSFAVGVVISVWGSTWLPGLFTTVLPLPVVGGLIAAIIYAGWAIPRYSNEVVTS